MRIPQTFNTLTVWVILCGSVRMAVDREENKVPLYAVANGESVSEIRNIGPENRNRRAAWPIHEGREIWGVDGAFADISWRRECVKGGVAPSANELAWFYRPLHGIRHRKIWSSQCACRGQKVNSIPLNCVLTREFLVKTKCLLVASWTVKIAPVLESSFSGFLQDLIRFKKIDDICDCKLLNGQTGTIQFGKVGKIFTDFTFPDQ